MGTTEKPAPAQQNAEWTIGRLLDWTREHFRSKGIDDPRLCAELLLAKALNCPKIGLYTRFNDAPTADQRAAFRELVTAAAGHKPIAYLIGHREFYSLNFKVTPDVLIPRPESELIVEHALAWCKASGRSALTMLDIGTGSGCLAIAIAKRVPAMTVVATDISAGALAVASENATTHGVADRVKFVEADLFKILPETIPSGGFDLIVSNPPYVAERDVASLPANVREFEPHVALFAGEDGLSVYRRMAEGVREMLSPSGLFIVEIGRGQGDDVVALFTEKAGLAVAGRYRDLAGIERTLAFTIPA